MPVSAPEEPPGQEQQQYQYVRQGSQRMQFNHELSSTRENIVRGLKN